MASKVDRIVARLQEKIADGDYYEAQQQTRVAASRPGQGGSGGDLCVMLVDVYKQAELKPDSATKGRLLTSLRLFDAEEPTRKKFITEMMA
ncbi:hypothetical protein NQ176_g10495 [Zarea fungicola]|uniref:Uncharacterized protein n=1 Tax=Zarea fungicola TaxID=93591 RepID=A0ACC1MFH2_9HYPO|nr:hypothetical protein NQ176_g10495 [Lecanicillium fungicola]